MIKIVAALKIYAREVRQQRRAHPATSEPALAPHFQRLVATRRSAGMSDFENFFRAPETVEFARKVSMSFDPEVQAAYPQRWIGKVDVETMDGRRWQGRVDDPKGDPGNTLTRAEIEAKALGLAAFSKSAAPEEMERWFAVLSGLERAARTPSFFPAR